MGKFNLSEMMEKRENRSKHYAELYPEQMEMLESSLLAKVRPIETMDVIALGEQLQAYQEYESIFEAGGNLNQLGLIPKIALATITATYGMSIMPIIATVQPIQDEQGIVYFENVQSCDTKGSQTAGDVVVDPIKGVVTPSGYASNYVDGEEGVSATVALDFDYTFTLAQYPIRSETLKLTFSNDTTIVAEDVGPKGADKNIGTLYGRGLSGTVNYITGAVNILFAEDPLVGNKVFAEYQVNFELLGDIPKINTFWDSKIVRARTYALKATVGMLQRYTLTKRFGDAGSEGIARKLVQEINREVGGDLIRKLVANAQGTTTHSTAPLSGVSEYQQRMSYMYRLNDAEAVMLGNAGRGQISVMVVGREHAAAVASMPKFVSLHNGDSLGSHVFGKLGNVVYVRVPETALMAPKAGVGLYKGQTPYEAALSFSPFMPLTVTKMMPESPNPLSDMQAAAMVASCDSIVPAYSTNFNIV